MQRVTCNNTLHSFKDDRENQHYDINLQHKLVLKNCRHMKKIKINFAFKTSKIIPILQPPVFFKNLQNPSSNFTQQSHQYQTLTFSIEDKNNLPFSTNNVSHFLIQTETERKPKNLKKTLQQIQRKPKRRYSQKRKERNFDKSVFL